MHIYPYKNIQFQSKYTLAESILRLSAHVAKNDIVGRLKGGVLGSVTKDKVFLMHLSPWRFYAGFLRFKGTFKNEGGVVILCGNFEINKPILMNAWIVLSILLFISQYIFQISEVASLSLMTLSVLMLLVWIFLLFIGYRRGKIDDIGKISSTITESLS